MVDVSAAGGTRVSGLFHWKDPERKDVLAMAALGAVYGLTGFLSLRLALVDQNVTPLWPPTGIAVVGVLVVAPLLLVVWNQAHGLYRSPKRFELLELVGVLSVLVVISLLAVTATVSVLFLVLPVVGWAAWRFQLWGAAPAALLVSSAATWAAVQDRGPFEGSTLLDK